VLQQLRPALVILLALTVITGVIYPLAITGFAQLVFPHQANGSIIIKDGNTVGSELIGQQFEDPRYFWGRLSDTGDFPYNAFNADTLTGSSGSNYGPMNPALTAAAQERIDALRAADPGNGAPIPVDLVTASGSGLDPNISIAAAQYQAGRVARLRGLSTEQVQALITRYTLGRQFGFLGEPRVNVLKLNMALDELH
jgi:potassium-transporting ATPase KdpC subunit